MWRRIGGVIQWQLALIASLCLLGALVSCALPGQSDVGHSSHSAATTQPIATLPPGPVTVTLTSEQLGTLAAQNVTLTVTVIVTNFATQTIGIAAEGAPCQVPPFAFALLNSAGQNVSPRLSNGGSGCIAPDANDVRDLTTIGGGQSQSWQIIFDLSVSYGLQPGPYTIQAQNVIWHEGPISNTGVMPGLHGVASGQLPITIY